MERYADPSWQESLHIRFDFNNMMAAHLGPALGITPEKLASFRGAGAQAYAGLQRLRRNGKLEWTEPPYRPQVAGEVAAYADAVRERFESFVVLGISGSALGNIALPLALNHPFSNSPPAPTRSALRQ